MITRIRLTQAILLAACIIAAAGQMSAQEMPSQPSRLALEVTYYPGRAPGYQAVKSAEQGGAYALFARTDAQNPPGKAAFVAVFVASYLEQEAAHVIISLLSGEKAPENKRQVAEYVIRETEKITVEELRQFGIQPFEIKLVRLAPTLGPVPDVLLKEIQSLLVVKAVANDSTLPSCLISLLNQSGKDVVALAVNVTANTVVKMSSLPRGLEGKPLIEAGKVHELRVATPLRARERMGGYEPYTPTNQRIEITAVVYADGTFEGDSSAAASFKLIRAREKAELSRLIPLLENAMMSPEDVSEALKTLEHNVRFPTKASNSPTREPLQPGENRGDVEPMISPIGADLVKEIRLLQGDDRLDKKRYIAWLGATKKRFESWLARV